ncbi:MAG: AP2 domain-containing protein [Pseudomonadales bacterium]
MKRNNNRSKVMYGISRIDDDKYNTHAWRVSLTRQGTRYVKNFPDKKHAGKGKALKLAKQFRDKLLLKYPPMTRKKFCSIVRGNNKTGISGVYTYAKSYVLRDGEVKKTDYWEANWPDENSKSVSVSFSVKTYGEDRAKELAIRAREKGLRSVTGVFWASARGHMDATAP